MSRPARIRPARIRRATRRPPPGRRAHGGRPAGPALPVLLALFALVAPGRAAAAQDAGAGAAELGYVAPGADEGPTETALERVQRDQARVGLRLESLRQKMERLAQRYDDEGRARNAELLRGAMGRFDEGALLDLSRELQRSLEQANLSSVEQQDALVSSLEDIQALLRDRRDVDDLSRQADLARQGLSELAFLAENERRLLSATRAATDRPDDLLAQALDLAERLARLLADASGAAQAAERADSALGEAALADQLARRQRELAGAPAPAAAEQATLEQALELLLERLRQPLHAGALGEEVLAVAGTARDEARARASEAAGRMAAARAALARHEAGTRADAPAGTTPGGGVPAGGAPEGGTPTGDAQGGESPADVASGDRAPGDEAPGGAMGPRDPGSGSEPGAGGETGGDAGPRSGTGEQDDGTTPGKRPPADPLEAAREEMHAAAAALERTRDALDRSERSLAAARNRARSLAAASSADARSDGEQMEELAERLETVQPEQGEELLDRTRALLEELAELAQEAERGDMQAAASGGEAARLSLDELIAMLRQRAAATGESAEPAAPDPAALEDLAQRQAELERRTRELMQRLSELPDQGFQEPAGRAGSAMGGAQAALRSGDTREATVREEEAAEQLEEARRTLAGEAERYEQLRQEEVLFRVGEELAALLERQRAISAETEELDQERGSAERLGRSQRRAVSRLSNEERDLSTRTESLRRTLEEDGALAFTFALERCRDDLLAVAELLSDEQTGYIVRSTQDDVVIRLRDLIAVLEEELERRRDAEIEDPPEGDSMMGESRPQLIPTVAELLLVQRMEQAALARLENFIRLNPELGDEERYGDVERMLLERWSLEHIRVTELFRTMLANAGGAEPVLDAGQEVQR